MAGPVPAGKVAGDGAGVIGGVDQVVDQAVLGPGPGERVGAEAAPDRAGPCDGRIPVAEYGPQAGSGVRTVPEREAYLVADVDAVQLGGDVDAEFVRQRQDVGVVIQDLLGRRGHDAGRGDEDVLARHGQDRAGEAAGQAVGLEQDDGPPRPVRTLARRGRRAGVGRGAGHQRPARGTGPGPAPRIPGSLHQPGVIARDLQAAPVTVPSAVFGCEFALLSCGTVNQVLFRSFRNVGLELIFGCTFLPSWYVPAAQPREMSFSTLEKNGDRYLVRLSEPAVSYGGLTGIWLSEYEYPSSGRGASFTGQHYVMVLQHGARLMIRSLPASRSKLSMDLSIDGQVLTGT